MLKELELDRIAYAQINLWATLLGALACLPAGWLLDRFGLRFVSAGIVLLLGMTVQFMSGHAGKVFMLFVWVLLTRALGQSALSVASITAAGKGTGRGIGQAMGVYSVVFMLLYAASFPLVGWIVREQGWRVAWHQIALVLLIFVAPLAALFLREPAAVRDSHEQPLTGHTLGAALRTRTFWIFAGATSLFNLALSGIGLFNEGILAEAGFGQETFTTFLAVMTGFTLLGQGLCGWLSRTRPLTALVGGAMFMYGAAIAILPRAHHPAFLWLVCALVGLSVGFITVLFFAIWSHAFGRAHLGRIQGAAQMLTVLASAAGPLVFATCHTWHGSYAPALYALALAVFVAALLAWRTRATPLRPENGTAAPASAPGET